MKSNSVKKVKYGFVLALLLSLLATPWAQAQLTLPLYEPFNYPNNERLGVAASSAVNWTWGNSTGTGSTVTTDTTTLSYPGLPAPTGIVLWYSATTPSSGRNRGLPFTSQTMSDLNSTVYYSFLLNVQANPNGLKQIFALSSSGTSLATAMTVFLTVDGKLALGKNSSTAATATTADALSAGTHLIVVRYKFVTGTANDEYALWVDPGSLGVAEGSVPAATISTTSGNDASALASLAVVHQPTPTPPGNFYVDEIRLAKTWAEVTPLDCTPGTAFSVTGGGAFCSGDVGVSVGLSGSETDRDYQLKLAGVDVGAAVAGTGAALDFGLQTVGGTYTVVASNTLTACVGVMTGNAVVTVNTAPSIGTQPTAQNPAVGGSTSFTVAASGAGLTYQWRRDGTNLNNGGNISGATSATLTINPVALTDGVDAANGYDVVISGTCSPAAISDRVGMVVAIPNNLTWVGDGIANLWDTTTLNWTGEATTFSPNDNVTFNDSGSAAPAVDLVGVISPNAVTVTGSQNYTIGTTTAGSLGGIATLTKSGSGTLTLTTENTFTGKATVNGGTLSIGTGSQLGTAPGAFVADQLTLNGGALQVTTSGSINANRGTTLGGTGGTFDIPGGVSFTNTPAITGGGSLTKIGGGDLVLSSAHTYAGGTVISNGTLMINNVTALGSGTVTLAGGVLQSLGSLDAVANNLTLTADSTIRGGNVAPRFNGTLSGTAGTLTFDGIAATFAPRLQGSFTFNRPIVLATANTSLRSYNTNTTQVFNGVISGSGSYHRRTAFGGVPGETIFNGDNTYSGGTFLTEGVLGFGISSTDNPVTSGPVGTGTLTFGDSGNNVASVRNIYASGGTRTIGNNIVLAAIAATQTNIVSGANDLTLTGTMDLGGVTRQWIISNSGVTTFAGDISNGSLTKEGSGLLLLNGNDTLTALTVVQGPLGGSGTINGPVTVNAGGTLAPGTTGIGTLTVNGDLTLNGDTAVDINAGTADEDLITGVVTANYGGTLTVNNLAGTLAAGQSYPLFSATTHNGSFANIVPATPGVGLSWSFANGVLSVITTPVGQPTLNVSQTGNTLTFTWTGAFKLQAQTNSLSVGLANNWGDYPGGNTSPVNAPIDQANGSVFFRLINQ
jgi:autotransporter-associated beta strand protein